MKKLILIILVIGAFLTACGGGGQTAELPPEEGAKPAEVSVPTSVAEATPVPTAAPTATPVPTPTPIPEPEQSPEYGPPPIIDLTIVYPDGESITIPIYCPVPAEYCDTGIEVYSEDWQGNVSYRGLGFILPEGTPIFAVGEGLLDYGGVGASRSEGEVTWKYEFHHSLYGDDSKAGSHSLGRKADWAEALPGDRWLKVDVHFEYYHHGSSAFYPYPETINGLPELDDDRFCREFWVSGGQELGRIVYVPYEPLTYWPLGPEGEVGLYDEDEVYTKINFVFEVEVYHPGTSAPYRIYFNSQPISSPEPTPTLEPVTEPTAGPTLTVILSDGSEVSIACPVPTEYCRTATEIFRDDGSFWSLGFTLPEGTPFLAVSNGRLKRFYYGWWDPASEPQSRYYPISYKLRTQDLRFHYSFVDDSLPTPLPSSATEVKAGQELGKAKYKHDKCVGACSAKLDQFNLLFRVEDNTEDGTGQTLRIRVD